MYIVMQLKPVSKIIKDFYFSKMLKYLFTEMVVFASSHSITLYVQIKSAVQAHLTAFIC